jgi:hypothetical protein
MQEVTMQFMAEPLYTSVIFVIVLIIFALSIANEIYSYRNLETQFSYCIMGG